jgi:hypothetical protein
MRTSIARLPPYAAEGCDEIYLEEVRGKSIRNRPELEKAIDHLGTGDALVVAEWDRATRSMIDGIDIIKRINSRGSLKVLDKPYLDLTTPLRRGFIAFLSAMAEDERLRIPTRRKGGMQAAKETRAQAQAFRAPASGSPAPAGSRRERQVNRQGSWRPPRHGTPSRVIRVAQHV